MHAICAIYLTTHEHVLCSSEEEQFCVRRFGAMKTEMQTMAVQTNDLIIAVQAMIRKIGARQEDLHDPPALLSQPWLPMWPMGCHSWL